MWLGGSGFRRWREIGHRGQRADFCWCPVVHKRSSSTLGSGSEQHVRAEKRIPHGRQPKQFDTVASSKRIREKKKLWGLQQDFFDSEKVVVAISYRISRICRLYVHKNRIPFDSWILRFGSNLMKPLNCLFDVSKSGLYDVCTCHIMWSFIVVSNKVDEFMKWTPNAMIKVIQSPIRKRNHEWENSRHFERERSYNVIRNSVLRNSTWEMKENVGIKMNFHPQAFGIWQLFVFVREIQTAARHAMLSLLRLTVCRDSWLFSCWRIFWSSSPMWPCITNHM